VVPRGALHARPAMPVGALLKKWFSTHQYLQPTLQYSAEIELASCLQPFCHVLGVTYAGIKDLSPKPRSVNRRHLPTGRGSVVLCRDRIIIIKCSVRCKTCDLFIMNFRVANCFVVGILVSMSCELL
jgi:hypothetical protein